MDLIDGQIALRVIAVIVSLIGIYFASKRVKKPAISFYKNYCISLIDNIEESLKDIDILYKGQPTSKNLIFFKAIFINSGNIDIIKTRIIRPLEVELPVNYQCMEYKTTAPKNGPNISATLVNGKLFLEWDLFKPDEYFIVSGLIEYTAADSKTNYIDINLFSNLIINQRIENLNSIQKQWGIPKIPSNDTIFLIVILLGAMIYFGYMISLNQLFEKGFDDINIIAFFIGLLVIFSVFIISVRGLDDFVIAKKIKKILVEEKLEQ